MHTPIARRSRALISMIVASLVAVVAVSGGAAAAPPPVEPATRARTAPTINWTACHDSFFCGRAQVPLDYDRPQGPQISLALIKLPASDPARRIGSLFVNPGGPGGSGVDFVRELGQSLFTTDVRARFDIVGFDPRGINTSTPLQCFETLEDAIGVWPPFPYPNTREEKRIWVAGERRLNAACAERGGRILEHMSTADVARDLDQLRLAVGDQMLTYYGVSYGSFLGNVYANLFPHRVRALVIDGVLDPVAWSTGRGHQGRRLPFSTRLRSAAGAQDTLNEFFRLCDASPPSCAFATNGAARYAKIYRSLKRDPLLLPQLDGSTIEYDETFLVADTLGALYRADIWPVLASFLVELEAAVAPSDVAASVARLRRVSAQADYPNIVEGFPGVACSDSVNPRSYAGWSRAAARSKQRDGLFGPLWTWSSSQCAEWPGRSRDRYLGPFTRPTAQPVLVVGNLFDPATPYHGAVIADQLLPNSRLLTVRAWGHSSLFASECADQAIGRYLLTSQTPPRGTVCQPNEVPFQQFVSERGTKEVVGPVDSPPRPRWSR